MNSLSVERLLEIHALVIHDTGGSAGLRDLGRLESAIAAQTQVIFGEEIYPDLFHKAAALIRGIIGDHPFVDGNKRTAMLSGLTFLSINGYKFSGAKGSLEDFAVKVATDRLKIEDIANWLKSNTTKT